MRSTPRSMPSSTRSDSPKCGAERRANGAFGSIFRKTSGWLSGGTDRERAVTSGTTLAEVTEMLARPPEHSR